MGYICPQRFLDSVKRHIKYPKLRCNTVWSNSPLRDGFGDQHSPQFLWHNSDDSFSFQSQFSGNILCCYSSDPSRDMGAHAKHHADLTLVERLLCAGALRGFGLSVHIPGSLTQTLFSNLFSYSRATSSTSHKNQATPKDTLFLTYSLKCTVEFLHLSSDSKLQYQICRRQTSSINI